MSYTASKEVRKGTAAMREACPRPLVAGAPAHLQAHELVIGDRRAVVQVVLLRIGKHSLPGGLADSPLR